MGDEKSLYKAFIVDPLLQGYKPKVFVIGENDEIYLSVKDTAEVINLSPERIRGLVYEQRIEAIKPGGHDLFISLASAHKYVTKGKKQSGRPPKISS